MSPSPIITTLNLLLGLDRINTPLNPNFLAPITPLPPPISTSTTYPCTHHYYCPRCHATQTLTLTTPTCTSSPHTHPLSEPCILTSSHCPTCKAKARISRRYTPDEDASEPDISSPDMSEMREWRNRLRLFRPRREGGDSRPHSPRLRGPKVPDRPESMVVRDWEEEGVRRDREEGDKMVWEGLGLSVDGKLRGKDGGEV